MSIIGKMVGENPWDGGPLKNQPLLYTLYITLGIIFSKKSQDWLANLKGLSSSNLLRRILGPVLCTTSVAVVVYVLSTFLPQVAGTRVVRWQEVDEMIGVDVFHRIQGGFFRIFTYMKTHI